MTVLTGAVNLLERAVCYAMGGVGPVTPALWSRPTPCSGWDLLALLRHLNDSLSVLYEGIATGYVGDRPGAGDPGGDGDPVAIFQGRAARLLAAWAAAGPRDHALVIAGRPLASSVVAATGAIEVAVHGWDVHQARGRPRPIPAGLALALLAAGRDVITDPARGAQFAAPVPISPQAEPGDRLVALLGRDPGRLPR